MNEAVEKLQKLLDLIILMRPNFLKEQEENKVKVVSKYKTIFSLARIKNLTELEFKEFLKFEENLHWRALHRQGGNLCQNMQQLRKTLGILVDETIPIDKRLIQVKKMPYLGKAIITAILQVTFPYKYGVWNKISEAALKSLAIFPKRNKRDFGNWYCEINEVLLYLSKELRIDLWTLDTLLCYWWKLERLLAEI